ncbi:hypothetical protein V3C99_018088 [Haemonchus contortus]|uniref:Endo/exonuclease/phosphatase domain-containing protein n=1 Tax=Haemonchus contortus TaxID=6289 RepID=A0A7I4Z3Y1_HAECO
MKIVVVIERQKYHLFSAYAPPAGCSDQTKDTFWNLLDEKTAEVPLQEAIVVAGDLNGHIAPPKPKIAETCGPARIKWWRLKEKEEVVVASILLPTIAKKDAKKAVAFEKAAHHADLNKKLKSRDEKFFGINDENGRLSTDRRQVLKRWREYFANISAVEFAHPAIPCAPPEPGPVQKITVNETITALEKMKSGKATGPDDVAADLWKSKGWNPAG